MFIIITTIIIIIIIVYHHYYCYCYCLVCCDGVAGLGSPEWRAAAGFPRPAHLRHRPALSSTLWMRVRVSLLHSQDLLMMCMCPYHTHMAY